MKGKISMKMVKLPSSDLVVSALTVGCWSFGGDGDSYWGKQEQRDVDGLVREAIDIGANTFDTAIVYNTGAAEVSLGKAIKGLRDKAVIGDKIMIVPWEEISEFEKIVTDALKRLGTEYLDIMSIHWPTYDNDLLRRNIEELAKLREKGVIKNIGVSNFGPRNLEVAIGTGVPIVANQMAYNLMCRAIEVEVVPKCIESGIGIAAYMPLMQGTLTGKYAAIEDIPSVRRRTWHFKNDVPTVIAGQNSYVREGCEPEILHLLSELRRLSGETGIEAGKLAIGWLCAQAGITTTIAGCRNIKQLHENAAAVSTELSADVVKALDDASAPIKEKMNGELDIWRPGKDSRIK